MRNETLLSRLRTSSSTHIVEKTEDGFNIIAQPEHTAEFSDLVREALNSGDDSFVILPSLLRGTETGDYERAHVIPFD